MSRMIPVQLLTAKTYQYISVFVLTRTIKEQIETINKWNRRDITEWSRFHFIMKAGLEVMLSPSKCFSVLFSL